MIQPDYFYELDEWESTYEWSERELFESELLGDSGKDLVRIGTLIRGPDRFLANVPVSFDDDGCPDDWEPRWFDTEAAALAALAAKKVVDD